MTSHEETLLALTLLINKKLNSKLTKNLATNKDVVETAIHESKKDLNKFKSDMSDELTAKMIEQVAEQVRLIIGEIDKKSIIDEEFIKNEIHQTAVSLLPTDKELQDIVNKIYKNSYPDLANSYKQDFNTYINDGIKEMNDILFAEELADDPV